ncbi:uncharacterized protein LOC111030128 [Myzus persicae]|uniref:uncharacterized protein LOC111030128 n=1 Tax=Myzus persicae TaxID=13164 RepID=UPI000B93428B|nr:uncharacterized protein LOC111030128 [Myzus persicae]XP_022165182.1 uncharacterized protein LOC111030128 [Myzus persicae]
MGSPTDDIRYLVHFENEALYKYRSRPKFSIETIGLRSLPTTYTYTGIFRPMSKALASLYPRRHACQGYTSPCVHGELATDAGSRFAERARWSARRTQLQRVHPPVIIIYSTIHATAADNGDEYDDGGKGVTWKHNNILPL